MSVKQRLARLETKHRHRPHWPAQSPIGIYADEADFAQRIADPVWRHVRVWLPEKEVPPDEPMPDLPWLLEDDRQDASEA